MTDPRSRPELPATPPADDPLAPPDAFKLFRATEPPTKVVLGDGTPIWLVTRWDHARAVLADPRFSSDTSRQDFPTYGLPGRDTPQFANSIIRRDKPEHLRLRRMLIREFSAKRVAGHEQTIRAVVTACLDDLERTGPPGDFVERFALVIPSAMIGQLLGVPSADHEFFQTETRRHTSRNASDAEVADSIKALHDYMFHLAAEKERAPGDDMISRLVERQQAGELSRYDVASYALLLVAAGHDTTAGAMALGLLTLVQRRDLLTSLAEAPDRWGSAVDELLRFHSVVRGGPRRLALEDVELGGATVCAGDGVMVSVWAANHDENRFHQPEDIDPERSNANTHLAFGYGPHLCMGQSLARLELLVGLREAFARFPGLRLDTDLHQLPFRSDSTNYGLYSLPLAW